MEKHYVPREIRTHANIVLLYEDRAYKLKKPVKFPFLDYSTLELRRTNIQAEFDLNRRFSPEIYLGVCEVFEREGSREFGELLERLPDPRPGILDYAVVMRRIPEGAWLPARLADGRLGADDIHALLDLLARTWASHPADTETRAAGTPDQLRYNTVANIAECERFVPQLLSREAWSRLDSLLRGWFEEHPGVFDARVAADRMRDGHGDLKPSNIAFVDGRPVVTDCIEFDPLYRRLDTLAETCFLATGLELLHAFDHASEALRAYRRAADDDFPEALRRYYQAHFACVIAKVTALQLDDPQIADAQRDDATKRARHAFALADFHAREPHAILIGGVIGSGKSTRAAELHARLGWPIVNSDIVRKQMMGVSPAERLAPEAYHPDVTQRVYQMLADEVSAAGTGILVDAQFPTPELRRLVAEAARSRGGTATFVLCDAPDEQLRERLERRASDPSRVSDASEALLTEARRRFEPMSEREGFQAPDEVLGL